MDGPGYHIDLGAVSAASSGITQTLADMDACEIEDICGPTEEYGSNELHDAFRGFCDRWQHGTEVLLEDAEGLRDVMDGAVLAYLIGEHETKDVLSGYELVAIRAMHR